MVHCATSAGVMCVLATLPNSSSVKIIADSVVNRRPFFTGRHSGCMLDSYLARASDRNCRQAIPRGSNKKISSLLNVSVKTVESQRSAAIESKVGH